MSEPRHPGLANIGKLINFKGEVTGTEDLMVNGTVEGRIVLEGHSVTIGANAHVTAEVWAKSVTVVGYVVGNVSAGERIEIADGGTVDGDVTAPKIVLAEGAKLRGSVDMLSGGSEAPAPQSAWREPEPQTAFTEEQDAPAPDDIVDKALAKLKERPSRKKNKTEEPSEQTSEDCKDTVKLADMFDEFDPSSP